MARADHKISTAGQPRNSLAAMSFPWLILALCAGFSVVFLFSNPVSSFRPSIDLFSFKPSVSFYALPSFPDVGSCLRKPQIKRNRSGKFPYAFFCAAPAPSSLWAGDNCLPLAHAWVMPSQLHFFHMIPQPLPPPRLEPVKLIIPDTNYHF